MSTSMLRIQDCMTRSPHSIGADQKVGLARTLMRGHRIRHLPVLRGGRLVGMISERDIYWIETLMGQEGDDVMVSEAMSPRPYAVAPEAPLSEVVREMAEHKYGSAVVLKGEQVVVGVFTTTDALAVLAALLTEQETAEPAARPT
ncbi:XRE family transcriptional regulator [Sorangium cellulosum]|uniref:XRE family transcriptional regulator n=1 Tax=Sorangium cellulosum TaxID=56 RepID=A0A150SEP8_SORCE|nr:XRE family transcriptional regulator [Sorangium cellulosum]